MLRVLGVALGSIILLLAVVIVGINLYLQSDGVKQRLQAAFYDTLGVEANINRCGYTPWGGITLNGVLLKDQNGTSATINKVRLHCKTLPLLDRRLIVSDIEIAQPKVSLADSDSSIDSSDNSPAANNQQEEVVSTPPAQLPENNLQTTAEPRQQPWQVEIKQVRVSDGSLSYFTASGDRLVHCENLMLVSNLEPNFHSKGEITVAKVNYRNVLQFENLHSRYSQTSESIELAEMTAELEGGKVNGRLKLLIDQAPILYESEVKIEGTDIVGIMDFSGLPRDRLSGTLNADLLVHGQVDNWESANGRAHLEIHDGSMSQIEILQTLGQALQIDELVHFDIKQAHANAQIINGVTQVDDLVIRSSNMKVTAAGKIESDGQLDLDAKLHLHAKIRKRLPDFAKDNMRDSNEDGYKFLNFKIDGTVSKPKSNVLERLIGQGLENKVKNLLENFFGD